MNPIDWWGIIILPVLIFLARICDVTVGTIRIIFVSKGQKLLAPVLGFFEVLIWIIAMGEIMQNLDRWYYYIFYAGGFAVGNYFGILLEEKLAMGYVNLRLITKRPANELIEQIRERGYGLTFMPAEGSTGKVHVIFITLKRSELESLTKLINTHNPRAFYTVEDMKAVKEGIYPNHLPSRGFFTKMRSRSGK
jgi:uncharacterized protein YebE (UPF0316 family)